ncbi:MULTISPECIES: thiamine pyrophosphate-dependent enzyme [Desulfofundulus]|jgi:2-oxoglutarate ferredoxin oxidoreductase subunit beta|uniref:2-oxoglutarate ferredoxin oxidoreductase subunit beta n=1 Tax=Desulfofundulus australicus DSM 11792 TaxID=1121425 RepID=A0A1M5AFE2_9FIRM|nr:MULTISPECIES: thiamine pyrophosphate-dependent enzyme [Desulfofundulus]MBE3584666.1 2-oxoglutarate oxidoreductase [Thermoanaerobacter sp.]MCS5694761.1 thiamine pyrophosphate-dependent enzyme [Desulfofundulus thermocisternus]SHF28826.1 2-oxoglutarate ferredoxin oxidoreductase subunit beta [Desulfofundulus australicus DSM 11792]
MKKVFTRPRSLKDIPTHYCPGCTHGIVHRLVAEVIDELEIFDRTIGVAPVGCSVFAYNYFDCDMFQASHGRAPAVATGIKRVLPDRVVFTYQGDGDLAAIGTGEIVHAAARGEKFTVIFINNAIYAMTGGQMAPTTLLGQKTTTTPYGRDKDINGYPVKISEMLSVLDGTAYVARVSVHDPAHVIKARKAIKRAFEVQLAGLGFSLVEVLSACPTNWGLSPAEALKWLAENMIPYYPLGEYKKPAEVG